MNIFDDETLGSRVGPFRTMCHDLKDLYHCCYEYPLTQEEIDEMEELTWFKGHQIIEAFDLFAFHTRNMEISPRTSLWMEDDRMFRRIRNFWVCPFTNRLMKIFSHDGSKMTYTDWMDMFNAYHKLTPVEYKIEVAFRIFDFDDDGYISVHDVVEYLRRFTADVQVYMSNLPAGALEECDYWDVAVVVVQHYDLDGDGLIGLMDFKLGMRNDGDFENHFFMSIWLNRDLRDFGDD